MTTHYKRIRKNANKKIAALIESAKSIVFHGNSVQVDDSYESYEFVEEDSSNVFDFMTQYYGTLTIYAVYENEEMIAVEIKNYDYYWGNTYELKLVEEVKDEIIEEASEEEAEQAPAPMAQNLDLKQGDIITVDFPALNKNDSLEMYKKELNNGSFQSLSQVEKLIKVNQKEWDKLTNSFLVDSELWENIGGKKYTGNNQEVINSLDKFWEMSDVLWAEFHKNSLTNVVLLENTETGEKIAIDTSGHGYARYVGFIISVEEKEPKGEKGQAPKKLNLSAKDKEVLNELKGVIKTASDGYSLKQYWQGAGDEHEIKNTMFLIANFGTLDDLAEMVFIRDGMDKQGKLSHAQRSKLDEFQGEYFPLFHQQQTGVDCFVFTPSKAVNKPETKKAKVKTKPKKLKANKTKIAKPKTKKPKAAKAKKNKPKSKQKTNVIRVDFRKKSNR